MKQANLGYKVSSLEKQMAELKTSQILSGGNSEVYHRYIEVQAPTIVSQYDWYYTKWSGTLSTGMSLFIASENDNPFELLEVEKMEVWRNDKLITGWSSYIAPSNRGIGQKSSLGDIVRVEVRYSVSSWQTGTLVQGVNRLGPMIIIDVEGGPNGCFTDNPPTPFDYTFKLWIRTTNPSEYRFLGGA